MKVSKLMYAVALVLLAIMILTPVHAVVAVTVSPASQIVPQGSTASYLVGLAGSTYNEAYGLTVLGLPGGSVISAPSITTVAGAGSGSVVFDASSLPGLYCPGTYTFQVKATSTSSPPDIGTSAVTSLTVTPVGPSLHVTISTDKPTYRVGDKVTIVISVNRPAEGQLTITPPSGAPSVFSYVAYGPTYAITKTFTADKVGRYGITFQADDFCSGFDSSQIYFDVTPDTYDVSISLSGVPPDVSVNIKVDGALQGTMGGSEIKKLSFKVDTQHSIELDQYVSGQSGYRYFCAQNTWNVGSAGSRTFEYEAQVQLSVSTDPAGVTQVTGDGWYKVGAVAQTSQASLNLTGAAGTIYIFKGWKIDGVLQSGNPISVTMDKPHQVIAAYETQYQLLVDSAYGSPQGAGFYAAGSTATFSVTSPSGLLIQQVFTGWDGDFTGSSATGTITMDKPHRVHANWTTSYLQLEILVAALAAIVVVSLLLKRRRGAGPAKTKLVPATPEEAGEQPPAESTGEMGTIKCTSCGADVPAGQTFCENCGNPVSKGGEASA